MKRYRIYKVLKWISAVEALSAVLFSWIEIFSDKSIKLVSEVSYLSIIAYTVLAIFFKLQEDSNKPTAEEQGTPGVGAAPWWAFWR